MWDRDNEISNLKPILDPLAIRTSIIRSDDNEIDVNDKVINEYNEINVSSNLNNIKIIFFRHQHILIILKVIIITLRLILDFSTSKVDIL